MAHIPPPARLRRIRLLTLDCDGVLTDGRIWIDPAGRETKVFHVLDGAGIVFLQRHGVTVGFVTGRDRGALLHRARELGVRHVIGHALDKGIAVTALARKLRVPLTAVAHAGDDLTDLAAFDAVGLAIAVADARPELRRRADWITRTRGGSGVVREIAEAVLRAAGAWNDLVSRSGRPTRAGDRPRRPIRKS